MQQETYSLMHRMLNVASTKYELEIVLSRFTEIFECTQNSSDREDRFNAAWAKACIGDLYTRLHKPLLAELAFKDAISTFEAEGMALNAATVSAALARFYSQMRRQDDAEAMLKNNVVHLIRYWGPGNQHVTSAEQELTHFQLTGEMIEAAKHRWCKACNIDEYGAGFDFEDKAEK